MLECCHEFCLSSEKLMYHSQIKSSNEADDVDVLQCRWETFYQLHPQYAMLKFWHRLYTLLRFLKTFLCPLCLP